MKKDVEQIMSLQYDEREKRILAKQMEEVPMVKNQRQSRSNQLFFATKMRSFVRQMGLFLLMFCFLAGMPLTVHADTGPKPSVQIRFAQMEENVVCYGTLLSAVECTGPACAWDGNSENASYRDASDSMDSRLPYEIWNAFVTYEDADGYYFLQEGWQVNETKELPWRYYPPSPFKILLYYPETGQFAVSDICESYAFDSYYTVNMREVDPNASGQILITTQSYAYGPEVLSLIARILLTICIELAIAFVFGLRRKRQIRFLVIVNIVTQVVLNLLLNLVNYQAGQRAFVLAYVGLEVLVFVIEAVLYSRVLGRWGEKSRRRCFYIIYALAANSASFVIGMLIAKAIPGIF